MSGALEPPDIPRLMALQPDLVVVGPAFGQAPGARPDAAAWHLFRDLVPRREPARPVASGAGRDRIFVRDFVLSMSIGAYAAERDKPHRVRFSVEAEIAGLGRPSRDMRDVVSYDLITDSIRDVAASGHVAFVETIAEQIAERLLAHPRVETVRITVEKLDLGSHSVGVEIRRETAR
jgi:dihydroneopterin aldolase